MPRSQRRSARRSWPRYEFPYVHFHGRAYPLIPLTLRRGDRAVRTFALLDSGASISVFRPEIAKALQIPLTRSNGMRLGTPRGGVDIRLATIHVSVEETRFPVRIGFSSRHAATFNIVGREGFFRRFSICFNEMMKTVILVPLETLRS